MRWLARRLYLWLVSFVDERPDGWWPFRTGLVRWLGRVGWPKRSGDRW